MSKRLLQLIGEEQYDRYILFAFEYACREERFLQLREGCKTKAKYKKAFNKLCVHRRTVFLDEVEEAVEEIVRDYDEETALKIELKFLPYRYIDYLIKKRYYPKD